MNPQVSIIVPVHNAQATLSRCVNSIIHQEYTDFELLLVDDGSTDRSGVICDEFAAQDERITALFEVIRSEDFKSAVQAMGGYGTAQTGEILWEYDGN